MAVHSEGAWAEIDRASEDEGPASRLRVRGLLLGPMLLIALVGVSFTIGAYLYSEKTSAAEFERVFREHGRERIEALEQEILGCANVVRYLATTCQVLSPDPPAFRELARPYLETHLGLQGVSFNPRVSWEERAEFEESMQGQHPGFQIFERGEGGDMRRAPDGEEHVVVQMIAPLLRNEKAFGFDIASEPSRLEAIQRCRDLGEISMTGRLELVQGAPGLLLMGAVYEPGAPCETPAERRAAFEGVLVGVFQIESTVVQAVGHLTPTGIDVLVTDLTGGGLVPLNSWRSGGERIQGLVEEGVLNVMGRTLSVRCRPTDLYRADLGRRPGIGILIGGLLVTVLLVGYLMAVARHERRLRHEVTEHARSRTALFESELGMSALLQNLPGYAYRCADDPEWTLEFISDGVGPLTGYEPEEYLALPGDMKIHHADRERVWREVQDALAARSPFELEYRFLHRSGMVRWAWEKGHGVFAPDGELLHVAGFVTDVTERRLVEDERARAGAELRENQVRLKLLNEIATGISASSPADRVIAKTVASIHEFFATVRVAYSSIDQNGVLTVQQSAEPVGMPRLEGLSADLRCAPEYLAALRSGEPLSIPDVRLEPCLSPLVDALIEGGTHAVLDIPVRGAKHLVGLLCLESPRVHAWTEHEARTLGEVGEYLGVLLREAQTATERERAEQRQTMMMRELDHRVKNNLATVLALAEQTLAGSAGLMQFRDSYTGRIRALVRTHEAMASSHWEGVRLEDIVRLTVAPYWTEDSSRVTFEGDEVLLAQRAASPLCMALHELTTNAAKYGALSTPEGQIVITWVVDRSTGLHISWGECGGPPVETPGEPGFGTDLIHGVIEHELGGRVEMVYARQGLECEMIIPLQALEREPDAGRPRSLATAPVGGLHSLQ